MALARVAAVDPGGHLDGAGDGGRRGPTPTPSPAGSPPRTAVLYTNARLPPATRTERESEERIRRPIGDEPRDVGVGEIEIVIGNEHVKAGGVTTAHLEPV